MCEPVSLTLLAIGVATAVASHVAEEQAQDDQYAAAKKNREYAIESMRQQSAAINTRLLDQRGQIAQDLHERNIANEQARARASVSAGEAGVAGLSLDALMRDYDRASAESQFASELNLGVLRTDARNSLLSSRGQARDRIFSFDTGTQPSEAMLGLNIAGAAAGSYANYQSTKPSVGKTKTPQ